MRDAAAAALGATVRWLDRPGALQVEAVLRTYCQFNGWEVRQGGFLGLRAYLASRSDLVADRLPVLAPTIVQGYAAERSCARERSQPASPV